MMRLAELKKILIVAMVVVPAIASTLWSQSIASTRVDELSTQGALSAMRLLSQSQYTNTIAGIFGDHIVTNVRFSPVQRIGGLTAIGARSTIMTIGALEPLENSARLVATQIVSETNRELLIPCRPTAVDARDDECAQNFLGHVGGLLFRRPLTHAELDNVVDIAGLSVGEAGDFYYGLSVALTYMLMSPNFLYIQETLEADPAQPDNWRLDGYSMASRLSFFLSDAAPDSVLLDAAENGDLHTLEGLNRQVGRLLASPRVEQGVRAFFDDMLVTEAFDLLAKDPIIYPGFTTKVISEAREQLLRTIIDHLIAREGDYRDLFVTRRTFMSRELAVIYRLPVNAGPDEWVPYEFSEEGHRGGLLTLVGFLARYSHPGKTSPTNRGRGLRETLLCQRVPDPPPNVNFELFENVTAERRTARERLDIHNANPICAGCHRLTDPLGLILEKFDGAGQYRETENGAAIDTSGELNRVPVADAVDLGKALRDYPALTSCLVSRVYSFGTGQELDDDDQFLDDFEASFKDNDYRFLDLLRTIATSKAFFAVKANTAMIAMEDSNAYQD
jgi:hypothetical protein